MCHSLFDVTAKNKDIFFINMNWQNTYFISEKLMSHACNMIKSCDII